MLSASIGERRFMKDLIEKIIPYISLNSSDCETWESPLLFHSQ